MKPVEWTPESYAGLQSQLAYYAQYSQAAAMRLADKVDEALVTLETLPNSGKERGPYRTYTIPATNIVLIYRVYPNGL